MKRLLTLFGWFANLWVIFSITRGATAFSITTLSVTTLSITASSITKLSMKGLYVTLSIKGLMTLSITVNKMRH